MKLLASSTSTIQKHHDTLGTALRRKADNDTLSPTTLGKLAFIVNRQFRCEGYKLGAAFTGRTVRPPPQGNEFAELQLMDLRDQLATQRLQFPVGGCMRDYLGDVLQHLPQPRAHLLDHWRQSPDASPQRSALTSGVRCVPHNAEAMAPKEPKPDYPMEDATAAVLPKAQACDVRRAVSFGPSVRLEFQDTDADQEARTSTPKTPARQLLWQFKTEGLTAFSSALSSRHLWEAAAEAGPTKRVLAEIQSVTTLDAFGEGRGPLPSLQTLQAILAGR